MKTLVGALEPPPPAERKDMLEALKRLLAKAQREVREMPR